MSDNIFPIRYSQLNANALKDELTKRYELNNLGSCRFFDFGMNDIYVVKAGKETFYLRVSMAKMHRQCDYEEEVSIINLLHENGVRVVSPICCKDGKFVWEVMAPEGKRYVVLFREVMNEPSKDEILKAYNLGLMLAKMHTIADKYDFIVSRAPIDLTQLSKRPLELLRPHLAHRPIDYEFLCGAAETLERYVKANMSCEKPYFGFCHGDIHTGNVYFQDSDPEMFDFDCMGYGWRIYDLSVFLWNEMRNDEKYIESDTWKGFLDGYNSARQLIEIELASINDFAALRQLWLMGIHADVMERNAGCCWYHDKYFDDEIKIFQLFYERASAKLNE